MSNRTNYESRLLNIGQITVNGKFNVGATGAPSSLQGNGLASIARTGVGAYTITLQDQYRKLISANAGKLFATTTGVASIDFVEYSGSAKTVKIACYDYAGAAVDPADGSQIFFSLDFLDSSVLVKGE